MAPRTDLTRTGAGTIAVPALRRRIAAGIACALVAAGLPGAARAQQAGSIDTRLRLDQDVERRKAEQESRLRERTDDLNVATIEIDGTTYTISRNASEMGKALYVSIARKRWTDVRRFLAVYRTLPQREEALVLYADGALARERGDLSTAMRAYRRLVALQSDFLPGRLELARVLFMDRRDREAVQAFEAVRTELAAQGDQAKGVIQTVDIFLGALRKRRGFHGVLSIGPEYSTNLNQSSASYTCLIPGESGDCLFDRTVPDPIAAGGISIEGNLTRRVPLGGHDGIAGRALLFGDIFPGNGDYSQTSLSLFAGYDRRTARTGFVLAPSYDLGTLGRDVLYDAWGAHGEYSLGIGAQALVRLEANYRGFDYHRAGYEDYDGGQTDVSLTGWYVLPRGWTLFAGPDIVDKQARDPVNAFRQLGARIGLDKAIGKAVDLLLTASLRSRDYKAYSPLLEAKRDDIEQNYTMLARFPSIRLAGLSPSLFVQHNRVSSNVDWLYSYNRTVVSLRVDHVF